MHTIRSSKIFLLFFIATILTGCAHSISISPDFNAISGTSNQNKLDKSVVIYYADDIEKEVITPGGGGDKVKYKPYRDLDAAILRAFSNSFKDVTTSRHQSGHTSDYIASISLTTNSSSPSLFTWPPTIFSIDIHLDIKDVKSNAVFKIQERGEGRAEFNEFKGNFGLSAQRASTEAITKLQSSLVTKLSTAQATPPSKPSNSHKSDTESRLHQLKILYEKGLIDINLYRDRQREILKN
jgi:hypothetical protein